MNAKSININNKNYDTFHNFEELITGVESYNPDAEIELIKKAAMFAYDAHKGQKRASGEPFFAHCYEVAKILAGMKMDSHSIIVGLLHDTVEDTSVKLETIEKEFDAETRYLVESVTKLELATKEKFEFGKEENIREENIRKIMLATSKDVRVILIKLADRLHNMRTLKYLPEVKRKIIAKETMDIYAPIAQKLGIFSVKAELEDLSFRFMEPEKYAEFKKHINKKRDQRQEEVKEIMEHIKKDLKLNEVQAQVFGRAKHFYSIFKKISEKNKEFNEIYDLIGIRIICKNIKGCYTALGVVHKRWRPMPGKFKDYIAVPKHNGYESLHTTVIGSHGRILEVQIRTEDMHHAAEEGIAAHWRYKGTDADKRFDKKLEWLKQILDWKRDSVNASEFIENMKVDLFDKEIYVFTPKGDPISLPENATPVDFAYAVHTDIGNHCSQAKINNKIAQLDYKLFSGDVVEILTKKNQKPKRSWLAFVKSTSARSKIKNALQIKVGSKYNPKRSREDLEVRAKAERELTGDNSIHLEINIEDKIGSIAKVLSLVSTENLKIVEVNTRSGRDNRILMNLHIQENEHIDDVLEKIKKLSDVLGVQYSEF